MKARLLAFFTGCVLCFSLPGCSCASSVSTDYETQPVIESSDPVESGSEETSKEFTETEIEEGYVIASSKEEKKLMVEESEDKNLSGSSEAVSVNSAKAEETSASKAVPETTKIPETESQLEPKSEAETEKTTEVIKTTEIEKQTESETFHVHTWVAKTNGHYETVVVKEAYDEKVLLKEAYEEKKLVKEAYDEEVIVKEGYSEKVLVKEAYVENKLVKAAYDEEVLVKDAWNETVVDEPERDVEEIVGYESHEICSDCGIYLDLLSRQESGEHVGRHMDEGGIGGFYDAPIYTYGIVHYPAVTHTVNHPAEYKTVHHAAEYKTVNHAAEYKTVSHDSVTKTIHHEAEYKTIKHEAEYKTVHHAEETKKQWVEETTYSCSCGATK